MNAAAPDRDAGAIAGWSLAALAAFVLAPWYSTPYGLAAVALPGGLVADAETASALAQALLFRQPALLVGLAALLSCLHAARLRDARTQARWLVLAGFGGAAWLLLHASLSPGASRLGFGWGAGGVTLALLVLGAFGLARRGAFRGELFTSAAAVLCACVLAAFVAYPLLRGMWVGALDEQGRVAIATVLERAFNERIWGLDCLRGASRCGVAWNTLLLALLSAAGTTVLGTLLALAELRSGARAGAAVRILAPLPFVTPPFIAGLALVLLFGRAGPANQFLEWAFGIAPGRWLYGLPGLWLAQMFAFTPVAYLIMRGVLQGLNPALEEAARSLRAGPRVTWRKVTLPLLLPGFTHAFLVGFFESMADFGNPIIVAGQYAVLSTEIFYAIVGAQFDQGRAAGLAWILALFALGVFVAQRAVLGARQFATTELRPRAEPLPLPPGWRTFALLVAAGWLLATGAVYCTALSAAFVESWGRDFTPTLRHVTRLFDLSGQNGELAMSGPGWPSLLTTVKLAGIAAALTVPAALLLAWLLERNRFRGRAAMEFTLLAAFAIPGTVLGLSYILVFSAPPIVLTGSGLIIVLCLVFRNLPVAVGLGTGAFRQVDRSLDEASRVLGAPALVTLRQVLVPLLRPALVDSLIYGFVRSMTTVSGVVFLVTAETELAATYIITRVGQGDFSLAFAYCAVLVVLLSLFVAVVHRFTGGVRLARAVRGGELRGMRAPA